MTSRRGEQGSILIVVLVIMILAGTLVAALISHAEISVRTEKAFKGRSDRIGSAQSAMAFMVAAIRVPAVTPPATTRPPDGSQQSRANLLGLAGSTTSRTASGFTVSCVGDPGSGAATGDGFADRSVTCSDSDGTTTYHFQLHIVDDGGTNLGAAVQVRSSDFDS